MILAAYGLSLFLSLVSTQGDPDAALLAQWASQDTKARAQAWRKIEHMEPGPQTRLLRKGMQFANKALAARCAFNLLPDDLSNSEAPRYLELLWNLMTEGGGLTPDLQQFVSLLGSQEVPSYLAKLPSNEDPGRVSAIGLEPSVSLTGAHFLSRLDAQLRPEHIPLLCEFFLGKDLELADKALGQICKMLPNGDLHRDLVARCLLRRKTHRSKRRARNAHGLGPVKPLVLTKKNDGYPPLLHDCLEHFFEPDQLGLRFNPWKNSVKAWLARWSSQVSAGSSDLALLRKLLGSKQLLAEVIALRGLGQAGKKQDLQLLRSFAESSTGHGTLLAWVSVARLGEKKALDKIRELASTDVMALGFLLELAPDQARPMVEEVLKGGRTSQVEEILDLPATDQARQLGIRLSWDKDYAWLEGLLRRGPIPILHRIALLVRVPPFRSQSLLLTLADPDHFRALTQAQSAALYEGDLAEFLALLETSSPRLARRFLQGLAQHEVKAIKTYALDMLLKIGSPDWEDQLIEHVRWASEQEVGKQLILLGRTKTDKVKQWLVAKSEEPGGTQLPALRGLGIAHGLPEPLVWLESADTLDPKSLQQVRQLLTKGHAQEALAWWIERYPPDLHGVVPPQHIGLVKDPRITESLLDLQKQRETGYYAWATGQLAMQGHPQAKKEQAAVYRIGRYRWIDEADPWTLLLDKDLTLIPFWLERLDTCAYVPTSAQLLFDEILGLDFSKSGHHLTPHRVGMDWWKRAKGRLRYSHILDRYVISAQSSRKAKGRVHKD